MGRCRVNYYAANMWLNTLFHPLDLSRNKALRVVVRDLTHVFSEDFGHYVDYGMEITLDEMIRAERKAHIEPELPPIDAELPPIRY